MNEPMRRHDRQMTEAEALALLEKGEYGVLSTLGEDGWPYSVPVNYALLQGKIVFHCAAGVGKKLRNLAFCPRVCFTVVGDTQLLPQKFSTKYESVVAFGTAAPAADKPAALLALVKKYSPAYLEPGRAYIAADAEKADVYAIHIEQLTGKARR